MVFDWLFEGQNAARLGEGLLLTAQISLASVAASFANNPTTVTHAEAIAKSYPTFFEDFRALGGNVELTETTE